MHSTVMMCLILKVSECGYYAWRKRPVSKRAMADAVVTKRIRAIQEMSDGTYGAPRIRAELADVDGLKMSTKRIFRLMKCQRLQGVRGRRFVTTTVRDEKARKAPDLVKRHFKAKRPNALWVADITVPVRRPPSASALDKRGVKQVQLAFGHSLAGRRLPRVTWR